MIGVPRGPSVMTAQQTALPPPPPPPPPLIPQPPRGNSRNRNAQPPLAPSAYHRPLARNYGKLSYFTLNSHSSCL